MGLYDDRPVDPPRSEDVRRIELNRATALRQAISEEIGDLEARRSLFLLQNDFDLHTRKTVLSGLFSYIDTLSTSLDNDAPPETSKLGNGR